MEATFFIGLLIVAFTQMLKMAMPQISGFVTIIIALVVGVVVAIVDEAIGVIDVSIAEGVVAAFQAVGMSTLASKAGGGARGDGNVPAR